MEFFEKYRLQNVGATRARLAELITIFENERHELTIRELNDLRDEIVTTRSTREACGPGRPT